MRVVPQDSRPEIDGAGPFEPTLADHEPASAHFGLDAMRSWLVNGVHLVDRRRRFGSHGRARELLVVNRPEGQNGSERWQALAAALHRHTVRGGLSELSPDERHVITLAYLEGRTNREIAALLGVSITTVRRRLWIALGRLEAYIGRSGVWLSALILVAAAYALRPATRVVSWVTTAAGSTDRAQRLVTTVTAGAMSAAILGVVAFTSDSAMPGKAAPRAAAPLVTHASVAALPVTAIGSRISPPPSARRTIVVDRTNVKGKGQDPVDTSPTRDGDKNNGCDGNPTSAPPSVPVGPRAGHPTGAPVTHPDAGGCRATG